MVDINRCFIDFILEVYKMKYNVFLEIVSIIVCIKLDVLVINKMSYIYSDFL